MAKLNIDIGVNLGNSSSSLAELKSGFNSVSISVDDLSKKINLLKSSLGEISKISLTGLAQSGQLKIAPTIKPTETFDIQKAIENAKLKVFASIDFRADEFLRQSDAKIAALQANLNNKPLQLKVGQIPPITTPKVPDVFTNYNKGANDAKKSTTYANMALVDMGRIVQDLPYGFLGISNNLNPLLESFRALKVEAAASNQSLGKLVLGSLTSFGGVGIAISAVSAALSFASVGLTYWTRGFGSAKKESDDYTKSLKKQKDAFDNLAEGLASDAVKITGLVNAYKEANTPLKERKAILNELKSIAPEYFNTLSAEKSSIDDLTLAYDKFNKNLAESLQNKVIAKQAEAVITKILELENVQKDLLKNRGKARFIEEGQKQTISEYQQVQQGILGLTKDEVAELQKLRKERDDLLSQIKDTSGALKGLAKESTKDIKPKLTFKEAIKEIEDDISKIQEDPLLKQSDKDLKTAARLREGLSFLRDEFKIEFLANIKIPNGAVNQLRDILNSLQITAFGTKAQEDFAQVQEKLKTISETADILGTDRLPASINEVEGAIARLVEFKRNLSNEKIGEDQLNNYANTLILITQLVEKLQERLKVLGEQKSLEDRVKSLREFGISMDLLSKRMSDLDKNPFLSEGSTDKIKKQAETQKAIISNLRKQLGEEFEKSKGVATPFILYLIKELEKGEIKLAEFEKKLQMAKRLEKLGDELKTAFADALTGIFDVLTDAFAGGNIGEGLKNVFANLTTALGKALIQFATSAQVVDKFIKSLEALIGTPGFGVVAAAALAVGIGLLSAGKMLKKADGGYISGEGTGTSDSIPARLSNGEYVVRASSVSKYGVGFLNAINQGTFKRFASGGLATNLGIPGLQSFNINSLIAKPVTVPSGSGYIAETRISGQDLRLILSRSDSRFNSSTSNPATSKSFLV